MTWILFYGGHRVVSNLTEANVTDTETIINKMLKAGGGWLDVQIPSADGLTFAKLRIDRGVSVEFWPDIDNRDLVQGL